MSEFVHREKNNYDILKNVDYSIGPSHRVVIDASAFQVFSPNVNNRMALENRDKSKCYSTSRAKCHCHPASDTEGFLGKDAEIEK
jgi:hypothetical protein